MGLEINTNKTKSLVQSRGADKQIHSINVMEERIKGVKGSAYLRSHRSTNSGEENEIQRRLGQANRVYFSLLPIMSYI
jgi:hypothetical protein